MMMMMMLLLLSSSSLIFIIQWPWHITFQLFHVCWIESNPKEVYVMVWILPINHWTAGNSTAVQTHCHSLTVYLIFRKH